MPRKTKQKRGNGRRRGRGNGPISDIPHNGTNITVHFKAIMKWEYINYGVVSPVNDLLTVLSQELGLVYKLYRFTKIKFIFQAGPIAGTGSKQVAIQYVPALDVPVALPGALRDFEGPATGYFESARGMPYTYTVPTNVLNAMPYNWYNTQSNDPEASDRDQGYLISRSNVQSFTEYVLAEFTMEFQTLEDPHVVVEQLKRLKDMTDVKRSGSPSLDIELLSMSGGKSEIGSIRAVPSVASE